MHCSLKIWKGLYRKSVFMYFSKVMTPFILFGKSARQFHVRVRRSERLSVPCQLRTFLEFGSSLKSKEDAVTSSLGCSGNKASVLRYVTYSMLDCRRYLVPNYYLYPERGLV